MKWLVFSLLILTNFSSYALVVISDLDDTIKITHVNAPQAIGRSFLSSEVFLGMPELLNVFKASPNNKLFIVTGSYNIHKYAVQKLLSKNAIKSDHVYLTNGSSNKPSVLNNLVNAIDDEIVLLGDNQENDPEYYAAVQSNFPEKIKAIYIHQLNTVKSYPGQIGYFTAYEIAVHEATAGRLTIEQAEQVKNFMVQALNADAKGRLLQSRPSELLIPRWQKCSVRSVESVLSLTRSLPISDSSFLDRIERLAIRNCDD